MTLLLDVGSHSLKVYWRGDTIDLLHTVTWPPLPPDALSTDTAIAARADLLSATLGDLTQRHPSTPVRAVGTALARNHPAFATAVADVCSRFDARFEVISHDYEADLIRRAAQTDGVPHHLDIINAGGHSIQIINRHGPAALLRLGIIDLNHQFDLTGPPHSRAIDDCIHYLQRELPTSSTDFAYTGGEATYLRHLGVPLDRGYCHRRDFVTMANQLARLAGPDLAALSPHDPHWMSGAIASNCLVTALLTINGSHHFLASDLNISQGLITAAAHPFTQDAA